MNLRMSMIKTLIKDEKTLENIWICRGKYVTLCRKRKRKNECLYGNQVAQVLWGRGRHEECDGGLDGGRAGATDGV